MTKITIDTHHWEIPENILDWIDTNCTSWVENRIGGDEHCTWVFPEELTIPEEIREGLKKIGADFQIF